MAVGAEGWSKSLVGHCYLFRDLYGAAICTLPSGSIVCTGGLSGVPTGGFQALDATDAANVVVEGSCEELVFDNSPRLVIPDFAVGRFGHRLVTVYDRHLLQVGGSSLVDRSRCFGHTDPVGRNGILSSVELYDSVAKEWIALPSLPIPLYKPGVCSTVCSQGDRFDKAAGSTEELEIMDTEDILHGEVAATVWPVEAEIDKVEGPTEESVIMDILHEEVAAVVCPSEAAATGTQLWASSVEASAQGCVKAPHGLPSARRVTYLTFSRSSPALDAAMLASSIAVVAKLHDVDIQPSWARGAKIFVAGCGPEHLEAPFLDAMGMMPSHVVLYADDIDDFLGDLQHLSYTIRKVKPRDATPLLPDDLSLMHVSPHVGSTSASSSIGQVGEREIDQGSSLVLEVVVRNTFFELSVEPSDDQAIVRRVRSADF